MDLLLSGAHSGNHPGEGAQGCFRRREQVASPFHLSQLLTLDSPFNLTHLLTLGREGVSKTQLPQGELLDHESVVFVDNQLVVNKEGHGWPCASLNQKPETLNPKYSKILGCESPSPLPSEEDFFRNVSST